MDTHRIPILTARSNRHAEKHLKSYSSIILTGPMTLVGGQRRQPQSGTTCHGPHTPSRGMGTGSDRAACL